MDRIEDAVIVRDLGPPTRPLSLAERIRLLRGRAMTPGTIEYLMMLAEDSLAENDAEAIRVALEYTIGIVAPGRLPTR